MVEEQPQQAERDVATMAEHGAPQPILAPGAVVGSYSILRFIDAAGEHNGYLARVAGDDDISATPNPQELHLRLIEGVTGGLETIRALEALQLRHPRLLALRDFFTQNERDYAVLDIPGDTWPVTPQTQFTAEEALAIGVIIGEVLIFLHSRGVAHTHIDPAHIVIVNNGVYLAGIETAANVINAGAGAAELFRQDANQLAGMIGTLTETTTDTSPTSDAAIAIAARGTAHEYTRIEDILTDCVHALPDGLPQLSEAAATAPMAIEVGHATTVGLIRQQNQDSIGVLTMEVIDDQLSASPGGIFLVADGMGGEAQGEVASRIAARMIVAEVARRFLSPAARATASDSPVNESQPGDAVTMMHLDSIASLVEAFRSANARIRNMARRLEKASGTTTSALMLFGHEALLGHVGDSRVYLLRGSELHQLTKDHSLVQKLIDLGQYNPVESPFSVPRNYLYRSLGQTDDLEVDTRVLKVGIGDTFMICSDGLWDLVLDPEIREIMLNEPTPTSIAEALVRRANAAGGHDNSTAVVVRLAARTVL